VEKIRLSVVLPTYNCRRQMARHLASMATWADLADEIIVVDSRSTDGTLEFIRERLRHPNLRIIERDRGLYQSWNEGIAATSGDWVYISTAGDTIERAHLLHLLELGERTGADVVISPPRFIDETGAPCADLNWPPAEIVRRFGARRPFVLGKEAAITLSYLHCPRSVLGSSASNLYRGPHLRVRPFPEEFRGAGDSAWILRHAEDTKICFTPRIGSAFCVHDKPDAPSPAQRNDVVRSLIVEKRRALRSLPSHVASNYDREVTLFEATASAHHDKRVLWHDGPRNLAKPLRWLMLLGRYLSCRVMLGIERRRLMSRLEVRLVGGEHH